MKPNGENIAAQVLSMYNEDGESVESCPHSKQVLYAELSAQAKPYDLMRVKAKESGIQYTWV